MAKAFAHQHRFPGHHHLKGAGLQSVLGAQIALTSALGLLVRFLDGQQLPANQGDEQGPYDQNHAADGREIEQPKRLETRVLKGGADQQVRWRADQSRESAEQAAVGQRHQQSRRGQPGPSRYVDDYRQHQRSHADVVHEGG